MPWWLCPNRPRCPHGAVLHDVYDYDDQSPRCCVDGCGCGDPGMVSVVKMAPVVVPYPVSAEHPPADFDG